MNKLANEKTLRLIKEELEYAKKKHPVFPGISRTDPRQGFEGLAIILEELGEVAKAYNSKFHTADDEPATDTAEHIVQEVAQVAAVCIRMIDSYFEG